MSTVTTLPEVLVGTVKVVAVQQPSPSFRRITLGGDLLRDLGACGFDTRLKVVFPGATGGLPEAGSTVQEWYVNWQAMAEDERAPMRTYTVREVIRERETRLVVDFVLHGGQDGPAARWAAQASIGDEVCVVAPHASNSDYDGVEFAPGGLRDLLIAGDETALPAIAGILRDCETHSTGQVFIEVPCETDILPLHAPDGMQIHWLSGRRLSHGQLLVNSVREQVGLPPMADHTSLPPLCSSLDVELWETPRFSSACDPLGEVSGGDSLRDSYVWVAGESALVKALRRSFVSELGLPRSQGAFMGYWRQGVAMRS